MCLLILMSIPPPAVMAKAVADVLRRAVIGWPGTSVGNPRGSSHPGLR